MSRIIEAHAYAQQFEASHETVDGSKDINASAILSFLALMFIVAVAGLFLNLPVVTLIASAVALGTIITAAVKNAQYNA
ncbi:MAG: hypothetical protein ACTHUY_09640 [Flaviflexus sp.]|uniref:hypothetical protein n=1 Tax=Flaviflexus sp. TaxID=1969482 RepID=UPI003F90BB5F